MDRPAPDYEPLAQIEVDEVKPERQGFMLTGQGPDSTQYQLDLRFELPLDPRTRTVLGELLSHSDLIISRRARRAPGPTVAPTPIPLVPSAGHALKDLQTRRERAHKR